MDTGADAATAAELNVPLQIENTPIGIESRIATVARNNVIKMVLSDFILVATEL